MESLSSTTTRLSSSRSSKRTSRHYGSVLPPLASLPRKQEQYKLLCKVQATTLTDENTYCRQALKTTPIVNKTTQKFNKDFVAMTTPHHVIDSVQLDRLKRCSRTFSRIIQNCPKYGSELTEIKKVYDSHLNFVLQSIEKGKESTGSVGAGVLSHDWSHDKDVVLQQVLALERNALEVLKDNERLEKALSEEREVLRLELPPMTEDTPSLRADSSEGLLEYTDHVTHLQQQILDHRSEANKSLDRRINHVPLTVCQKLEQCIRSTELSIQRLNKQNLILKTHVQEMEEKLQRYFHALETPIQEIESLLSLLQGKASKGI